ncbi:zinc ribbon domain-containing protein YjdM [Psittacicella gerlachiana]|uniref:Alkylphosphonate utilization protein n=1 Tax=Psittacicella gerlachiana TaxID=2028574 RepID=A0A3A1YCH4_9GAMM|nr:zinc ribbon domain-containing protein YjdM [Psittacicella gerlachiana]RIY34919.1 alkylphosphonate utilization protein [Psittacicella gerlachiana]
MSDSVIHCPKCSSEFTYFDGVTHICSMCAAEFDPQEVAAQQAAGEKVWKDAFGNILENGDTVTLIKPLKVKGTNITLKQGTKVKNIRLVDGDHDVDCKIDGQAFGLKSEFLKKAN